MPKIILEISVLCMFKADYALKATIQLDIHNLELYELSKTKGEEDFFFKCEETTVILYY